MTTLKIKYRAIKWDNYQGGSGMPFNDVIYIGDIQDHLTVGEICELVSINLSGLENTFVGEIEKVSVELI